ncbi:hypothetical protein ELY21_14960 [Legionella sp. km535]|uniref:hypothetical protein n=1 Tax=Legionella sp. km535 TaxID=2498107 RepID=UPI000F8E29F4|nr:hypothetical protein [Legionella sp. km535]RUR15186.1 hypothetical protein ELY21_14960 [Legionella sp. km535]
MMEKFCIFCGENPRNKTSEHVLPRWLISLTGNPNRVVNFGQNPLTLKTPRFDWSNFKFPSCDKCNNNSATLEGDAHKITNKILLRQPISIREFDIFLDWLDKVRIGLWLAYQYLHKNPLQIFPKFYINNRIGIKDRMLAIYPFNSQNQGMNIWGAETLTFQFKPSCFSIRINDIYILNMSWDFMCAKRCGFPYPKIIKTDLAEFAISGFKRDENYKHPILRMPFYKPSIHIYQPLYSDEILNKFNNCSNLGNPMFIQLDKQVEKIEDPNTLIDFQEIKEIQSKPQHQIISQTYDFQLRSFLVDQHIYLPGLKPSIIKKLKQQNKTYAKVFYNLTEDQYEKIWAKSIKE